ncbi:Type 1 glutamine amidotransferase-like domain-containing protein [Achromobacter aloeverae]|uniref:Peptidase E n=1 Tax=Achromobacter aloeverae TaxID=1750518 RepID=A0A4Q1HM81_9BURK|nr:peptidase E [Achromobacter aloeverae]RXN91386.1 peptidase E [Achromobacter aloeverae]
MKRILAIGGGGFMMEDTLSPIDEYIVSLTGKVRPRICYLATASGDLPAHLDKFHAAYGNMGCETSHLAFFRQPDSRSILVSEFHTKLLEQDAIFVGGGNTKSALAVWREWGLDNVLKEAWEGGVLLAGMSAGAMCWFEAGVTDSLGRAMLRPLDGLGFLRGGCAVHYSSDQERRRSLHAAHQAWTIPTSIAIDDFAAALYVDASLDGVVSWRAGSTAYQTYYDGDAVVETAMVAANI